MAAKQQPAAGKPKSRPRESVAELAPRILELLPATRPNIARALERKPSDGTVRRALAGLIEAGAVEQDDKVFRRCQELPTLEPPAELDEAARRLHAVTLKALQEQGTWRDHDVELLNDYCRRSQDARTFREAHKRQPFTTADSGRVYAHPAIDKERDARRDAQALREALVATPDARKKHGRDDDGGGEPDDPFDF